jgi:hypothetical protein
MDRVVALRERLRRNCEGLTLEQLNWKPALGAWSVAECLLHLLETDRRYLERTETAIERGRAAGKTAQGPFRYGRFGRWFLTQLEPPPKRRLPAPRIFRPARREAGPAVVRELDASLGRLLDVMRAAGGLDLARIRVATPVSPLLRLQLGIVLQALPAHTDRHLGQIERILARPGFPRTVHSPAADAADGGSS